MNEPLTFDLADFGQREYRLAATLLTAYCDQGADFLGDGVKLALNRNSGFVFLTDEDYNVGMMHGDKLEQFHSCGNCGNEGFAEDIAWNEKEGRCGRCAPQG